MDLSLSALKKARENYDYPPGYLDTTGVDHLVDIGGQPFYKVFPDSWYVDLHARHRHSSIRLDSFHARLLLSDNRSEIFHGLLSVVFWGYLLGRSNRLNHGRAHAKAKEFVDGRRNRGPATERIATVDFLCRARDELSKGRIKSAINQITQINFLGLSFGSKVLAFMNPSTAGVYDKIISDGLLKVSDHELRSIGGATSASSAEVKAQRYEDWCSWCKKSAEKMNSERIAWTDWDANSHPWRAVDIERAIFHLLMKEKSKNVAMKKNLR